MRSLEKIKLLAIATFALLLLSALALLLSSSQFIHDPKHNIQVYLWLVIIILFSVALFVELIYITGIAEKSIQTLIQQESSRAAEENLEQDNMPETEKEEIIDIPALIEKIIPTDKTDINKWAESLLSNMATEFELVEGLFFLKNKKSEDFEPIAEYAFFSEEKPASFKTGDGLAGQAIKNRKLLILNEIPNDYIQILSGLGKSTPKNLALIPIFTDSVEIGLIEIASFQTISKAKQSFFTDLSEKIAIFLSKPLKS
jgi:hypothetical protein